MKEFSNWTIWAVEDLLRQIEQAERGTWMWLLEEVWNT